MTAKPEPFGDYLFEDVTDLNADIRRTVRNSIALMDVLKHRSKRRSGCYSGGPVIWQDSLKGAA